MVRDYNQESEDISSHKYRYNFDLDIMHHYMMQSFIPFFRPGNALELGSYRGDFTSRLLTRFSDLTCVEASSEANVVTKERFGNTVELIEDRFESMQLSRKYDNIIMTHVLEHLDNPTEVLFRINNEWLSGGGYFFLVCPNAHAPSRQIAVKMGVVESTTAVTPSEVAHGHRRTYTLETLENDAVRAGLKVIYRSGIFFKAFANFQWDKILATKDIVSPEFLDGCYALGQQYPDLCASIFLVCEKGT